MNAPRLAADPTGSDWGEDAPTALHPRLAAPEEEKTPSSVIEEVANNINAPELASPGQLPHVPQSYIQPTETLDQEAIWDEVSEDWEDDDTRGAPTPKTVTSTRTSAKRSGKGSTKKGLGMRLTERDIEILSFLGRYRAATVNQIARHVDSSLYAIRNRLPRMHKEGMLAWSFTGQAKPKVWTVTDTGLKVAGLNLSAPTISWGTLRHTLGLVDLGTTFELAGERVITEREIRAALRYTPTARMKTAIDLHRALDEMSLSTDVDTHEIATTHYTLPVPGKNYGHIPDMVVVRAPFENGASGSIAVELELNRKTLSEWRNIITAYRDTPHFAQAVYYVVDVEIERALRGVIHALGAEHRVSVIRFEPLDTTAIP